ncbi:MAG: hypothetical protein FD149_1003 [Rhodospirillaceae bacterium]|nr:MAG: hypothetical protein FD149_1003 [Rhodospirillaceae bacterium]
MGESAAERLRTLIRTGGPVSVATFMAEAGAAYYARTEEPFGEGGDFITAPEISQIFGELIGLWCAVVWQAMGAPRIVRLVELGPGRGTLMRDALRAARTVPAFAAAVAVHLVETSPRLAARQRQRLAACGVPLAWHDRFDAVPPGPVLVVANEFLDALPVHQFERTSEGWRERQVGLAEGAFCFVPGPLTPVPSVPDSVRTTAPVGAIAEASPAVLEVVEAVAARLLAHGGAALFIDYGPAVSATGDSVQAVRRHTFHPVLEAPGEADLTAHVDFAAVRARAKRWGVRACGPVPQGPWLRRLGILTRAERLLAQADPAQARSLVRGVRRLIDDAEMGHLFKVLGLAHPALPCLPGLE